MDNKLHVTPKDVADTKKEVASKAKELEDWDNKPSIGDRTFRDLEARRAVFPTTAGSFSCFPCRKDIRVPQPFNRGRTWAVDGILPSRVAGSPNRYTPEYVFSPSTPPWNDCVCISQQPNHTGVRKERGMHAFID